MALLAAGSAVLFFSCGKAEHASSEVDPAMMTEYSEELTLEVSENGRRSFRFSGPLLEGYSLAREPYREFRKGVKIITYKDDSLSSVDAILTANYGINYINRRLWEARGNVVVLKFAEENGVPDTLYTDQLFWNQLTGRVYSNVDTRLVQKGGADDFTFTRFETDEHFSFYDMGETDGRTEVDVPAPVEADSLGSSPVEAPARPVPAAPATPSRSASSASSASTRVAAPARSAAGARPRGPGAPRDVREAARTLTAEPAAPTAGAAEGNDPLLQEVPARLNDLQRSTIPSGETGLRVVSESEKDKSQR